MARRPSASSVGAGPRRATPDRAREGRVPPPPREVTQRNSREEKEIVIVLLHGL